MEQEKQKSFGLWTKTSASGKTYLSGQFTIGEDTYYISMFKNVYKKEAKHPDFNFLINKKVESYTPKPTPKEENISIDDVLLDDINLETSPF